MRALRLLVVLLSCCGTEGKLDGTCHEDGTCDHELVCVTSYGCHPHTCQLAEDVARWRAPARVLNAGDAAR